MVNDSSKSGAGENEIYKPIWFGYDAIDSFLNQGLTPKKTINTKLNDSHVPNVHSMLEEQENHTGLSHIGSVTTPFDISPVPTARKRTSNRGRKSGKSEIISSSPYKTELEETEKITTEKLKILARNEDQGNIKNQGKGKSKVAVFAPVCVGEHVETCSTCGSRASVSLRIGHSLYAILFFGRSRKTTLTKKRKQKDNESGEDENEEWFCLVCVEPYSHSRSNECWIKCNKCQLWAHEACTPQEGISYTCHNCESDDSD
ncbi:unnamed protein product [Diatraea saccharalis]|uniref:Zinc finger PHD-type domain-containing protein n=1 Tax=Diatraea saccharalis TaxID=40085 RepID=A0A9N9RB09_9NEOP|nr:unnamed protein product [Diatraea saccharalis]